MNKSIDQSNFQVELDKYEDTLRKAYYEMDPAEWIYCNLNTIGFTILKDFEWLNSAYAEHSNHTTANTPYNERPTLAKLGRRVAGVLGKVRNEFRYQDESNIDETFVVGEIFSYSQDTLHNDMFYEALGKLSHNQGITFTYSNDKLMREDITILSDVSLYYKWTNDLNKTYMYWSVFENDKYILYVVRL